MKLGAFLNTWSTWSDVEERAHRLLSVEFLVYYVLLAVGYYKVVNHLILISENAREKLGGLQWNSWLGRMTDMSDIQSSMFRKNFLLLLAVMSCFVILRWGLLWSFGGSGKKGLARKTNIRLVSGLAFAAVFIIVLHGTTVIFIMTIVTLNYWLAKWASGLAHRVGTKDGAQVPGSQQPSRMVLMLAPAITWVFNISVLFANDYYHGYRWGAIHSSLAWMDEHRGMYQWHVGFNMIMLHMISFNMDYHWSATNRESTVKWGKHEQSCDVCKGVPSDTCYLRRQEMHLGQPGAYSYSYVMYLAYLFYVPLYLAGPIVTFNVFASQTYSPNVPDLRSIVKYGLRFGVNYVLFEVMCSFLYVLSINQSPWVWKSFTPWEIGMLGYFTIQFLWLKFNVMWKFFRWIALLDGIETIENMPRCVNNHYSISGFWRNWHRSYNRWLIRYLYVPMGGSRNRLAAVAVTFTFVAVWHDITLKLLVWGWGVTILFAPEMLAQWICTRLRWTPGRKVMASFASMNIFWLIVANVLGFSVGVDGMKQMLLMMFNNTADGAMFLFVCWFYLYIGASMMFEIRKLERAKVAAKQQLYSHNSK